MAERTIISTDDFIKMLPAWVWIYQGHAHPDQRFFYRAPRTVLYGLIQSKCGWVDEASGWVYKKAREAGCEADKIVAFVHGEPVTYVAIEA